MFNWLFAQENELAQMIDAFIKRERVHFQHLRAETEHRSIVDREEVTSRLLQTFVE